MKKRPLEVRVGGILSEKRKTIAFAESCTGGLISSRITDIPGSSGYFMGGVIAYSNDVKISVLSVPASLIKKHGAVSPEVAGAMVKGVRKLMKTDYAVSITGIVGPDGGSLKKPVGLAYMAFASAEGVKVRKILAKGTRLAVKRRFADAALGMVVKECL